MCVGGKPLHATVDPYIRSCEALYDHDGSFMCAVIWDFKVASGWSVETLLNFSRFYRQCGVSSLAVFHRHAVQFDAILFFFFFR